MAETALAVPFETTEIIEIAVQEFRKRLLSLSPLQNSKEYAGFEISFNHTIKLHRLGHNGGGEKETLAWGGAQGGDVSLETLTESVDDNDQFKSGTPNDERLAHNLPLTVETSDGKGGKQRKKVMVKDNAK